MPDGNIMVFIFPPYTIIFIAGLLISITLAIIVWNRRPAPGALLFALFVLAGAIWSFFWILEIGSPLLGSKILWAKLENIGILSTGVLWIAFVLDYTGNPWWRRPRNLILLSMAPLITLLLVCTNEWHGWYYSNIYNINTSFGEVTVWQHGWWFWVSSVYQYALILWGAIILWRFGLRKRTYGKQVVALNIGIMVPILGNIAYIFSSNLIGGVDFTPIALAVSQIIYTVTIFRYGFLDLAVVARRASFNSIPDGIIVVDAASCIADINEAAEMIMGLLKESALGKPLEELWPGLYAVISRMDFGEHSEMDPGLCGNAPHLNISLTKLGGKKGAGSGKLIILRNITQQKVAEEILREREQYFRTVLDSLRAGVVTMDAQTHQIEDVNQYAAELMGEEKAKIIGLSYHQFVCPADLDQPPLTDLQQRVDISERGLLTASGQSLPIIRSVTPVTRKGREYLIESFVDISSRKQAETSLRESEERFRRLAENAPDIIVRYEMRPTRHFAYVSPAITRLTGFTPEEYYEDPDLGFKLVHRDDIQVYKSLLSVFPSEKPVSMRYRHKDGTYIWLEQRAVAVRDKTGNVIAVESISRDITEQMASKLALQESEDKYRTIFESANDIFMLIDREGRIIDVNDKMVELGGYPKEQIVGKNLTSLNTLTQESQAIVKENFFRRVAGILVAPYEVELTRPDGQSVVLEINAVTLWGNSRVNGELAIFRDVTERKKATEALEAQKELIDRILSTLPAAVLVTDEHSNVLLANRAYYDVFKLSPAEVENRPICEILPVEELLKAISSASAGGESQVQLEFRHSLDNTERIVAAQVLSMKNKRALIILSDITEERGHQQKLHLADRLASIGEMAAGISHELNNPLTNILLMSRLLIEDEIPDAVKEELQLINNEAKRASTVVKNLLTFARKHDAIKQPSQVNSIIADVLKLRAYEHKVNNIEVTLNLDADLPDILVDYFQIQQVFLNIILNAEQVMIESSGKGRLTVTSGTIDGNISIKFADNGPGIMPDHFHHIFDPFFTTKEVGKGTGLGLSICYGIIRSHNGRIFAESELGKGATFTVELPVLTKQGAGVSA